MPRFAKIWSSFAEISWDLRRCCDLLIFGRDLLRFAEIWRDLTRPAEICLGQTQGYLCRQIFEMSKKVGKCRKLWDHVGKCQKNSQKMLGNVRKTHCQKMLGNVRKIVRKCVSDYAQIMLNVAKCTKMLVNVEVAHGVTFFCDSETLLM